MDGMKVFAGTSSAALTDKIAQYLDVPVGRATISRFPDGETLLKLEDDVRGRDCFVVQSTCPPVNDNLMELLIYVDCLRRASARRITVVVPYFGYARQDRKTEGRTPITAKLVANMIAEAGADRVLTMDLHADQIQGFFDIPLDHLMADPVITHHLKQLKLGNLVTVSPDVGNMKTANAYATRLGGDLAVIDKRRESGDSIELASLIGTVEGRNVLMFDDMIATAGTVCGAARFLREHGAKSITVSATHPVFAGPAVDRILESEIDEIFVTDTIPLSIEAREKLKNITVLSVAELMGEAIRRIHRNESVSALFEDDE